MLENGKEHLSSAGIFKSSLLALGKLKIKQPAVPEPICMERLNWLIHLQHIRREIESCKNLIKLEIARSGGKNEYAYFKQGVILREEGKLSDALESFQICLKLNPENPYNMKEIANTLYEMRRFRLSLEAFVEAEKITKTPDWQIYYYVGQCYLRLGDVPKAKEYAQKAIKVGKHEESYALLIKILTTEGDLKSAVAVSNAAIESCPDSVAMLTESGLLYLRLGQSQNAFERLSQALALEPTCPRALLGIGCITQKHQEYDVALSKYKIAIFYEPESVALWNNIGVCFYSKQKYVAAISCLKKAAWLRPLDWRVPLNLAHAYAAAHQAASAFAAACASANLRPSSSDAFVALAVALLELEDPENALRAAQQAAILSPEDTLVATNAALFAKAVGDHPQAEELLTRVRQLVDGGRPISKEVMDLVDQLASSLGEEGEREGQASRGASANNCVGGPGVSEDQTENAVGEGQCDGASSRELERDEV